ncbi:reverse transcriptase domain, Reverse transcriptase zinc-binding domain protein [Artemisia annua]|uniref:Reverse transcriptase domain, Reverse transcriptase zinc-binding domain protein n=1 Tax=Artemisia annua TaxID=35608 RepID=A0A2U1N9B7_ARTAN|nr:reverse transcriptase domain, Reverse transcriptase zinc-binding domain protein [Artemisia annua]
MVPFKRALFLDVSLLLLVGKIVFIVLPDFSGVIRWGWRKLLALRPKVRPFIWYNINNGKNTSIWFDMWSDLSPLRDMITPREIVRAGLNLKDSVYDVIDNGNWKWPADWLPKYPTLFTLPVPFLHDTNDTLVWQLVQVRICWKVGSLRPLFMLQVRFATEVTLIRLLDYACIILIEDAIG